jgi:hypothetical protein
MHKKIYTFEAMTVSGARDLSQQTLLFRSAFKSSTKITFFITRGVTEACKSHESQ